MATRASCVDSDTDRGDAKTAVVTGTFLLFRIATSIRSAYFLPPFWRSLNQLAGAPRAQHNSFSARRSNGDLRARAAARRRQRQRTLHCVTGVADHGTIDHGVTHHPIHDARGYKQIRGWLDGSAHTAALTASFSCSTFASGRSAGPLRRRRARKMRRKRCRMSNESLAAMLTSLQPIRFQPHEEPAVCSGARSPACARYSRTQDGGAGGKECGVYAIGAREHEAPRAAGMDWVTRLRSDYFLISGDADRINAAEPVVHATRTSNKHVWIKGWTSPTCYDRSDWFALAPRQLADAYFDLASDNGGATCEWAETTKAQVHAKHTRVARFCPTLNERILVEWLVQKGTFVRNIHGEAVIRRLPAAEPLRRADKRAVV